MDDLLVAGANLLLNVNKPNYNVSPGKGSPASSNHIVRSLPADDDYYYKRNEGSAPCNATNHCASVSSICSPLNQKSESFNAILPPFHRLARLESHFGNKQEKGKPRPSPITPNNNSRERSTSSGSGSDSPDSVEVKKIARNESLSISSKNKKAILLSKKRETDDRNARNSNVRSSSSDTNMTDSPAASASADSNSASNPSQKSITKKRRSPQSDMDKELLAKFRKESHSALEQRRRDKINDGINQLKELVEPFHNGKYDKASVLRKSIEYIQQAQVLQRRLVEENYALRDDNGQLSACVDVVRTQNRLLRLEMTKLRPDLQQHLAEEEESIAKLRAGCTYNDHLASAKNGYAGSVAAIDNKGGHYNEHLNDALLKGLYDRDRKGVHSADASKQYDGGQWYERHGMDREHDPLKSLYSSYCSEKRQTMYLGERDRDLKHRYDRHEHNNYFLSDSFGAERDGKPMYGVDRNGPKNDAHAGNSVGSDKLFVDYSKCAYADSSSQHSSTFEREPSPPSNPSSKFSSASGSGSASSSSSNESVYGVQLAKHSSCSSASGLTAAAAAASSAGNSTASASAALNGAQGQAAVSVCVSGSSSENKSLPVAGSPREGASNKASYGVQVQVQMPDVNRSSNNQYLSVGTDISINISSASSSDPDKTTDQHQTQIHHYSDSQRISKRPLHDDDAEPHKRFVHKAPPSNA